MPWRTIGIILIAALFVLFIAFNVDHKTEISFIFVVIPSVPVYLTVFFSMLTGALFMVPVVIRRSRSGKHRGRDKTKEQEIEDSFNKAVEKSGVSSDSENRNKKSSASKRKRKKEIAADFGGLADLDVRK